MKTGRGRPDRLPGATKRLGPRIGESRSDTVDRTGDDAMSDGRRLIRAAGLWAAISLAAVIFTAVLPCGSFAATPKTTKPLTSAEASPKEIQELMTLLGDPKV